MNAANSLATAVLFQVTAITLGAAIVMAFAGRRAALRHAVGVVALALVLASPALALLLPKAGWLAGGAENGDAEVASAPPETAASTQRDPMLKGAAASIAVRGPVAAEDRGESRATTGPNQPPGQPAAPAAGDQAVWLARVVWLAWSIWATGIGIFCLRFFVVRRQLRPLRSSLRPASIDVEVATEASRVLGIESLPAVKVSDLAPMPLVLGCWPPSVVLPRRLVEDASAARLRDVLIHECAHILRRDPWINLAQRVAGVIFWPHPGVHWLNRQIARSREEVCDNFVLGGANSADYAQTLLELAEHCAGPRFALSLLGMFSRRWSLEDRISGILNPERIKTTRAGRKPLALAGLLLAATSALVGGVGALAQDSQPHRAKPLGAAPARAAAGKAKVAAVLPTPEEILKIYRQNKERLSRLHVQTVHLYEQGSHFWYEAADADGKVVFSWTEHDRKELKERFEFEQEGKQLVATLQKIEPLHFIEPMEFFVDGQKYQRRGPVQAERSDEALKAWRFPTEPLTTESLPTVYREVEIFSRSPRATPIVRIWDGDDRTAYISQLNLDDDMLHGPPLIDAFDANRSQMGGAHPIDAFFSRSKLFRVLGQETIDGRLLTLVELAMPNVPPMKMVPGQAYPGVAVSPGSRPGSRAWLDLTRGALPMRIADTRMHQTMVTHRVAELPNGAFYPAKTVLEDFEQDPNAPPLTAEQAAEVEAGKRKPALVVKNRSTWDCSLVELKTDLGDDFFTFAFPERQPIWDADTGKMADALEVQPIVKVGQLAPPLTIERWVDGKARTLAELRGQVVVLDFGWHRDRAAELKELKERFAGKPVVFIAVYHPEKDVAARVAAIEKYQKENRFPFIAAIDAGWEYANAATRCAYGLGVCPQTVIIDAEGMIAYADPNLDGPRADEPDKTIVAAWNEAVSQERKKRFESVGETWPLPKGLSEEQKFAVYGRVDTRYYIKQIEAALAAKH